MSKIGTLRWTDRRGAGRVMRGNAATLAACLKTLRRPATLEVDHIPGEVVGEVRERRPSDEGDPRIRWIYWYDPEAVGEEGGS